MCLNNFKFIFPPTLSGDPSELPSGVPCSASSQQSLEYHVEICEIFIGKGQVTGNPCSRFSLYKVMMLFESPESLQTHHFDICHIPLGCSLLKATARSNVTAGVGIFVSDRTIPVQSP